MDGWQNECLHCVSALWTAAGKCTSEQNVLQKSAPQLYEITANSVIKRLSWLHDACFPLHGVRRDIRRAQMWLEHCW